MVASEREGPRPTNPRLVAVGVARGDAFLGADGDYRFLVDGGRRTANAQLILDAARAALVPVNRLDVVICTHSDNDHAYGILGVMRSAAAAQPAVTVRELWLPASWRDVAACSVTSATIAEWALTPADELRAALAPVEQENDQAADE